MAKGTCSIEICTEDVHCRGWCQKHYMSWYRYGDPLGTARFPRGSLEARFWPKVDKRGPDECWPWLASCNEAGYGMIGAGGTYGRPLLAHRVAYEFLADPIPEGLELDHLCHTWDESCSGGRSCLHRKCVNPAHLEPVSTAVNVLRGRGVSAESARKTHCKHGHPLTPDNTYTPPSGGRKCLTCNRENCKRYQERKRKGG